MAQPTQTLDLVVGGKKVRVGPSAYVAAGGEATIYKHGGVALRIYHDLSAMPPKARLDELAKITLPNVVKPIEIILDGKTGTHLGFSMAFVPDTEPLCRFFTKGFRTSNNIGQATIGKMVVDIQATVGQLIREKFLPVDLNELNILSDLHSFTPWFIDIASWATPSFRATAIMDSVRDPQVKGDAFTPGSTWYSFGVIATQMYLGIHPFHGLHPKYKMDWKRRMAENASIFEAGVKVPPIVPAFSTVPARHLEWMKRLFSSSTFRDEPPVLGAVVPTQVTPAAARVVNATGNFTVDRWLHAPHPVIDVYTGFGKTYVVTTERVYWVSGDNYTPIADRSKYRNAFVLQLNADEVIVALVNPGKAEFYHRSQVTGGGNNLVDSVTMNGGLFLRNGRFYSAQGLQLIEHEFVKLGSRVMRMETHVDNINELTVKLYDGVVYQDLFGKAWLTVPFAVGATVTKAVPVLDGYRVIDAKSVGHICVVVGEKRGKYSHFILAFNESYTAFTVRDVPDQRELNFTMNHNGICVMLVGDTLELFRTPAQAKVVDNPPIDASTKVFCTADGVYFIDDTDVHKLSVK